MVQPNQEGVRDSLVYRVRDCVGEGVTYYNITNEQRVDVI